MRALTLLCLLALAAPAVAGTVVGRGGPCPRDPAAPPPASVTDLQRAERAAAAARKRFEAPRAHSGWVRRTRR